MQRIIVDLPEPDGPMTTTTSRRATLRLIPCSAVNAPKRFTTSIELDHHLAAAGHLRGVGEDGAGGLGAVGHLARLAPGPHRHPARSSLG